MIEEVKKEEWRKEQARFEKEDMEEVWNGRYKKREHKQRDLLLW